MLGPWLLWGLIIQYCLQCRENLSLKILLSSSLVITQLYYQSMLQTKLYFSVRAHLTVFPVKLQETFAGLTILIISSFIAMYCHGTKQF